MRALSDFSNGLADDGGRDLDVAHPGRDPRTSPRCGPPRSKANLSFFDPDGDVVGASAFVDLDFDVTFEDGTTRQVARTGRFALGRSDGVWQVIGLPRLLRRRQPRCRRRTTS